MDDIPDDIHDAILDAMDEESRFDSTDMTYRGVMALCAQCIISERDRAMKAICTGCATGVEINEAGFHQHRSHTFPCHAAAIRL